MRRYPRLFFLVLLISASGCSFAPDEVVVAVPTGGTFGEAGDQLFTHLAEGLADTRMRVIKTDSGCTEQSARTFADSILKDADDIALIVGPLCYAGWEATREVFRNSEVPQIPLVPSKSPAQMMEDESLLLARFANEKMLTKDIMIAYVANQYGNNMAEKLDQHTGDNGILFPLANLAATTEEEAEAIVLADPTVLIVAGEYPKVLGLVQAMLARGLNSVLLLTSAAQPSLIINQVGAIHLARTRFVAAVDELTQANDLLANQARITLKQISALQQHKRITPAQVDLLPAPSTLRMIGIQRDGSLYFQSGL